MKHSINNFILASAASWFLLFSQSGFAAQNDAQLLELAEKAFAEETKIFGEMPLKSIASIRAANINKTDSEFDRYQLISYLKYEVEKSAFLNEAATKTKINLILQLNAAWKDELQNWRRFALQDQGTALLIRGILDRNHSDALQAAQSFEEAISLGADGNEKGGVVDHYAAQYKLLAELAGKKSYSRQAQVDLLKKGREISKQGQSKYPSHDFSGGIDSLYGTYKFVSGGSAIGEVIEEWIQYVSQRPKDKGKESGESIADALFELKRDAEARSWVDKYIDWQASTVKKTEKKLRTMYVRNACEFGFYTGGFLAYGERNPSGLQELNAKYCQALKAAASAP